MNQPTDPETNLLVRTREEIEKALNGGGWSPLYGILAGAALHIADSIDGLKDAVLDHTDPAEPRPDPSKTPVGPSTPELEVLLEGVLNFLRLARDKNGVVQNFGGAIFDLDELVLHTAQALDGELPVRDASLLSVIEQVAIPSLRHCERMYGHDDQARLNLEAAIEDIEPCGLNDEEAETIGDALEIIRRIASTHEVYGGVEPRRIAHRLTKLLERFDKGVPS